MYGWRLRIGLIIPSDNTVIETELNRFLLACEGITLHTTRIYFDTLTVQSLVRMQKGLINEAKKLKTAEVDFIGYGCTSGSFIGGFEHDKQIIKNIEESVNIPATTASTAALETIKMLGAKTISVGTPYSKEINERAIKFFETNGVRITKIEGLNIKPDIEIGKQYPSVAYRLAKKVNESNADLIFLSCTDLRTFEVISDLEEDLEKPVVSSNLCLLWHILKRNGISMKIHGYGKLMESYL